MTSLPTSEADGPQVIHGDCIEVMLSMGDNSVDSIVTDPPYGLGFMGKAWDDLPPGRDWAEECLRVLKPGGHLLAFGGTRTWHKLASVIDDAGFEMRDSIAWLYGTGFPKHRAALKPAFEPIVMARKPFKGSLTNNEATHGTGGLNIEASRTGYQSDADYRKNAGFERKSRPGLFQENSSAATSGNPLGRWPANVVLDEDSVAMLDEQPGFDTGGASRFFYVAKAPKKERPVVDGVAHATVKPLALMRWLVRLITPAGGTVLEPFAGSGTTVEACILEGFHCIAIEREAEYLPLIQQRIERAA